MDNIDQLISDFIFYHPETVVNLLKKHGYSVKRPVTLFDIIDVTFRIVHAKKDTGFITDLEQSIASGNYSNFEPISLGISAGLSIMSSVFGAGQAKKARELQKNIALAQLSNMKMLEEERIRTGAETERTRILLQTLQQYQSDLQSQSTQRIKDTGIYVMMLGAAIGIIWGTSRLISSK